MFIQTQNTPNPNSLKFVTGKKVSNSGSFEVTNKDQTQNDLIRNILSINGVTGIFLDEDFLSVNKKENVSWDDVKHIVISLINDFYSEGNEFIIDKKVENQKIDLNEIEKKIIKILETKIKPAVARDGGDIKFKEFKNGKTLITPYFDLHSKTVWGATAMILNELKHYLLDSKEGSV